VSIRWHPSALENVKKNQKEIGTREIHIIIELSINFHSSSHNLSLCCEFTANRRSTEISLVIKQTFEAAIITTLLPRSQIDIFVQVLQADGGV
jgi:ribonuclease PH